MIINKLKLIEYSIESSDEFSNKLNLITSHGVNSVGKSTFCRLIFHSLGYIIPSTEGMNFDRVKTMIDLSITGKQIILERDGRIIFLKNIETNIKKSYSLPKEHVALLSYLFDNDNPGILNNLLGLMYIDQEKGWTLLNRGKVIGNNRFSIDELVASLNNFNQKELFAERDLLEKEISKYASLLEISNIKEKYYNDTDNLKSYSADDKLKREIASLQLEINSYNINIEEIENTIRKDKSFFDYIESMNLYIKTDDGSIKVSKENIENSINTDYLRAQKSVMLQEKFAKEREKYLLEAKYKTFINSENLYGENEVQIRRESIDSTLGSLNIDIGLIKSYLKSAKSSLKKINFSIREGIRRNNQYIAKIHSFFGEYAKELGIQDMIKRNIDYIFTSDLKTKTGANFQKLILAFKSAVIKVVEEYINKKLFLVIDSPKAKELDDNNTKQIMSFLQRTFPEKQIIIASIFTDESLFINFDNIITINKRAIEKRK